MILILFDMIILVRKILMTIKSKGNMYKGREKESSLFKTSGSLDLPGGRPPRDEGGLLPERSHF